MSMSARRFAVEERVEAAARCVADARQNHVHFTPYRNLVRQLPLLLHQHGLGQTLSYIKIRSGDRATSTYQVIYRHLAERLDQIFSLSGDDLLDHLTRIDSHQYMKLAFEAEAFALALRQAIQAEAAQEADEEEEDLDEEDYSGEEDDR